MTELIVTHRSVVSEDQIDHLGHMNVRFYGENARAASDAFVESLGGANDLWIEPVDLYTRHLHEQLLDAPLLVRTGVLGVGDGELRLYHELVNADTDDLAASFVQRLEARAADGPASNWPPARDLPTIDIPTRGQPRSIRLDTDPIRSAPTLDEVRERDLAMRHPRTVEPDECGADGWLRAHDAPMLLWGGEPLEGASAPTLHDGPDGARIGWASMETRVAVRRLPRQGTRIQSFAATVSVADKVNQQVLWAFDLDRQDLLCTFEVVSLAFDTVGRRAVSIPDDLRRHNLQRLHPELRPT